MTREEKTAVNNLLAALRQLEVVSVVRSYYNKYGNDAPPEVLQGYIDKLQYLLDHNFESFTLD